MPTMTAIGVASPSAHGHAMISTATALKRACASRGSGPHSAPGDEREKCDNDDRRHEPSGDPIGQPLNRRARPLRLADHSHDAARAACRPPTRSAFITRLPVPFIVAPVTRAARRFLHRDGLARDHRFVDRAAPFDDGAVDRDLFAWPHAQQVADLTSAIGTSTSSPSSNRARRLRRHAEQRANGRTGPAAGAQLENLPEQHEHRDRQQPCRSRSRRRRASESLQERAAARACRAALKRYAAPTPSAISVNMLRARLTIDVQPRSKNGQPGPQHHRRREHEADPVRDLHVQSPAEAHPEHHVAHREDEDRQTEQRRHPQSPGHVDQFGIRTVLDENGARLQRHAANRAGTGLRPDDLRDASGRCIRRESVGVVERSGSSAIPHFGHAPGWSCSISGSIGHTYRLPSDAAWAASGVAAAGTADFKYESGAAWNRARQDGLQK